MQDFNWPCWEWWLVFRSFDWLRPLWWILQWLLQIVSLGLHERILLEQTRDPKSEVLWIEKTPHQVHKSHTFYGFWKIGQSKSRLWFKNRPRRDQVLEHVAVSARGHLSVGRDQVCETLFQALSDLYLRNFYFSSFCVFLALFSWVL